MSHTSPKWDSRYPDRDRVRLEAECLAECFRDQLLAQIPEGEIRAIYLKGSVVKRWESALDYVPEVSDVDMHIWFRDDAAWPKYLGTVDQALEVQRGVEERFTARISRPIHEPRPQIIVMNKMMAEHEGFLHSPRSTVKVLYGEEYPEADYSDSDAIKRHDATQLVHEAEWVDAMPLHLVDKPGRYLREALRVVSWRVSPAGPASPSRLRARHRAGVEHESHEGNRGAAGPGTDQPGGRLHVLLSLVVGLFPVGIHRLGRRAFGNPAAALVLTESAEVGRQWLAANPDQAAAR